MFADRDTEMKLDSLSEASCQEKCTFNGRILKIDIDGMDQAKFRVPRNVSNASAMKEMWRPALHVVGVICWGLYEAYILMEPDIPKDSNMQCTMLCLALSWAFKMLSERGLKVPLHLVIQADNTCRETKNNPFLLFCSLLVTWGIFKSVSVNFHRMGHTHGPIDQRFSVVALVVARRRILQTLTDFAHAITSGVHPAKGRVLIVHICPGTYNFQEWLWLGTGVTTPGITPNPWTRELHTNHSWRLVRRCDLPGLDKSHGEAWNPVELVRGDAHQYDCVLLLKEWESSQSLSQSPLVVLPRNVASRMCETEPQTLRREPLGERSLTEFRKTAHLISDPSKPWQLLAAAQWLREWTDANERMTHPALMAPKEAFSFVFGGVDRVLEDALVLADPLGWHRFAPGEINVRLVTASLNPAPKPKPKAKRKPPMAKAASSSQEQPEKKRRTRS